MTAGMWPNTNVDGPHQAGQSDAAQRATREVDEMMNAELMEARRAAS
jgi:hypothetical protein